MQSYNSLVRTYFMEEQFWNTIRDEFPITREYAYFQSAGLSPMPNCVLEAVTNAYRKVNQFGDMYWMEELDKSNRLRITLGNLINTNADNIVFAHNTSTAFTFLAAALKAGHQEEFNLISLYDEFPSTHIPFEFQGITVKFVKPGNGAYSIDTILNAADEKTLGVVCSYVQYSTGFRLDAAELGRRLHERGLLFLLNATQGFPTFEIDVKKWHIDAMAVSFHKWGCCSHVGSLFYTSEKFRSRYPSPLAGWLSVQPAKNDFIPTQKETGYVQWKHAGQYNFGTMNFQALAGLDAAMNFMLQTGLEKIRQRILSIATYLTDRLRDLPVEIISPIDDPAHRSAIVLVDVTGKDNQAIVDHLKQQKIITTIRMEKIRISCNFFNNPKDVDRLIDALSDYFWNS
jgi:cysteine desulfurase / selenocysteine lyase